MSRDWGQPLVLGLERPLHEAVDRLRNGQASGKDLVHRRGYRHLDAPRGRNPYHGSGRIHAFADAACAGRRIPQALALSQRTTKLKISRLRARAGQNEISKPR